MLDSAVQHYRQAYERNKHPQLALSLAQVETELGNIEAARVLIQALEPHRQELDGDALALLDTLVTRVGPNQASQSSG